MRERGDNPEEKEVVKGRRCLPSCYEGYLRIDSFNTKISESWVGQKTEGLQLQVPPPPKAGWQGMLAAGDLTMHGDWTVFCRELASEWFVGIRFQTTF